MATTARGTKILRFTPGSNSFVATTQQTNQLLSCSLASWSTAPTPTIPLSTLARRTDGTTFGLNKTGNVLFHVDLPTGVTTRIGKLTLAHHGLGHFSGTLKHVRGLAFSDQPHELWGILPCQTLKHQHVDCMIQINTNTGLVTSLHQLNRTDVMAIAVPPRAGGSWRGTTHFLWCASGGLYALKNPNEGYELKRIGTWRDVSLVVVVGGGGWCTDLSFNFWLFVFLSFFFSGAPTDGKQLRAICFDREGKLWGVGSSGLCSVDTSVGSVKTVLELRLGESHNNEPVLLDSLMWLPRVVSATTSLKPTFSEIKMKRAATSSSSGGGEKRRSFDLLGEKVDILLWNILLLFVSSSMRKTT